MRQNQSKNRSKADTKQSPPNAPISYVARTYRAIRIAIVRVGGNHRANFATAPGTWCEQVCRPSVLFNQFKTNIFENKQQPF